jgi:hypothetical protein
VRWEERTQINVTKSTCTTHVVATAVVAIGVCPGIFEHRKSVANEHVVVFRADGEASVVVGVVAAGDGDSVTAAQITRALWVGCKGDKLVVRFASAECREHK